MLPCRQHVEFCSLWFFFRQTRRFLLKTSAEQLPAIERRLSIFSALLLGARTCNRAQHLIPLLSESR